MPPKVQVEFNWTKLDEQPLSAPNIAELFSTIIPAVRSSQLLSSEEYASLVDIIKTAQVASAWI